MRSIVRRDTGETYREMLTFVCLSLWLLVGKPAESAQNRFLNYTPFTSVPENPLD
jgi:hypothetical protein